MYRQIIKTTGRYPKESIEVRYFDKKQEVDYSQGYVGKESVSIRPNSVLVAGIGCNWIEGAWEKVMDMVQHTNEQGICCWLVEMPDKCVTMPFGTINQMRNSACLYAHDFGFDWVLLLDNDVIPEKDMAIKLINNGLPVIVPYITDPVLNAPLAGPTYKPNTGVQPIRWAVLNCMLIWTKVLNCFPGCTPFIDMILEPEFFDKLLHYGHRAYQDTGVILSVPRRPAYTADLITIKDKMEFYETVDARRHQAPNRRALNGNANQHDNDGVYFPGDIPDRLKDKDKVKVGA